VSSGADIADSTMVCIVVEDDGHHVKLADSMYEDENAVLLSGDPRIPRIPDILKEYPGAQVVPWTPWSGEVDEVLSLAVTDPGGCRWIEDEQGGAVHVCVCDDADDDEG